MIKEEIEKFNYGDIVRITVNAQQKYTASPSKVKGEECFLFENIRDNKAFHTNVPFSLLGQFLETVMQNNSNLTVFTIQRIYEFKITKKGALLKNSTINKLAPALADEENKFSLPLDIPALTDLGIVSKDGKLIKAMSDKFSQVENFTQIIDGEIKDRKKIKIIDSGCGKAYLSFIVYHYLRYVKNIDVEITGIDLKADVVQMLNETAQKYGYEKMNFIAENIFDSDFKGADMLISLHACDKATDYTLFNAVRNGVGIILSVPCCQHELNEKFDSSTFKVLNRYGLIKERVSALFTDAIRASLLTYCGYKVKIAEFVPLAHSPKNVMIKAVKANLSESVRKDALSEARALMKEFNVTQELHTLLFKSGD